MDYQEKLQKFKKQNPQEKSKFCLTFFLSLIFFLLCEVFKAIKEEEKIYPSPINKESGRGSNADSRRTEEVGFFLLFSRAVWIRNSTLLMMLDEFSARPYRSVDVAMSRLVF